ncbi:peptide chain release factor 1 [Terricaulis silvestris]|uniref:Peptide chain release factor 1 n=1 Tax=Terricaulis silvestris TaxID=2686094 RepID=A0A6I6MTV3_9CAUL|nr:peptide chain release factor 1 [Terricaulis silvestris]QGZ95082.1 Peptide chain release factor 1 [Terricaulis silvestris]
MSDLARLERRLNQAVDRFERVEARLAAATDGAEIVKLGQEHAELKPLVDAISAVKFVRSDISNLEAMAKDGDAEMAALARDELQAAKDKLPELEQAALLLLAPKDKDESASAILEVRAGTGGDEAALFAADLFRMYQKYASSRRWRFDVESLSETGLGGLKEATASITGPGVFGRLRFESGVHRVQRVPETEAGGRIHTSAATVAVLPQPEGDVDIVVDDKDIRIDTMRASGAGGQHVNKTDSAVRITHIPSGIVVIAQEKSQHQNRANAMKVLKAKLYDAERARQDAERAAERKGQVGSGDRSERIRTYNFPQGRVTDHRINLTLYNLSEVIEGAIDPVLDALAAEDRARKLAALEDDA